MNLLHLSAVFVRVSAVLGALSLVGAVVQSFRLLRLLPHLGVVELLTIGANLPSLLLPPLAFFSASLVVGLLARGTPGEPTGLSGS